MKRFFAVLLAVMVLVGSAVPAFAAVNIGTVPLVESPLGQAGCVVVEDGVPYVQTFIMSTLTTEQRAVYDRFVALPNGRKLMFGYFGSNFVTLAVPVSNAKITESTLALDGLITFRFAGGQLVYDSMVATPYTMSIDSRANLYLITGSDFAQDIVNGTSSNPNSNFLQYYPQSGQVGWRDDLEKEPTEPEPPTPSEPDPEPIPPWTPGGAPPPSTGSKSPYVPYDVSVWDDFTAYLRTASGSATNIILFIMIPTLVVPLIVSIFKHFSSGGKSGGGGKTV